MRTAVPATVRDIITMRLVKNAKVQKTRCVLVPNLALITWTVKQLGRGLGPCKSEKLTMLKASR